MASLTEIKTVYFKEIREIVRDWKVILAAVVLPVLFYPFIFFGIDKLSTMQEKRIQEEGFTVALQDPGDAIGSLLEDPGETPVRVIRTADAEQAVFSEDAHLGIIVSNDDASNQPMILLIFNGSRERSLMALREIHKIVSERRMDWIYGRLEAHGLSVDRTAPLNLEETDIATVKAKSGHTVGKILPFIIILMIISGCSYTAVDLITGEKERGTLETLLATRVHRRSIITGKFLVILTTGMVSVILNVGAMILTLKTGIFKTTDKFNFSFEIDPSTVVIVCLCAIPIAILFSSILIVFSARAKSYQEGQILLLPFTLLAILPAIAAVLPGAQSDSYLVAVPVANVVICIREILEGQFKLIPLILANLFNLAYAGYALHLAVQTFESERSWSRKPLDGHLRTGIGRDLVKLSVTTFIATWVIFYFFMVPLQMKNLTFGLVVTLWGLILSAALVFFRLGSLNIRRTARLRLPNPLTWLVVPIFSTGILVLTLWISDLQMKFLPVPDAIMKEFARTFNMDDLPLILGIFLFAVSPGICEEFLFRGAFLGGIHRQTSAAKAIFLSSIMFGFLHFSVYRFLSTTLIGASLGYLTIITGSIFPAMLGHFLNNLIALFILEKVSDDPTTPLWLGLSVLAVIASIFVLQKIKDNSPEDRSPS